MIPSIAEAQIVLIIFYSLWALAKKLEGAVELTFLFVLVFVNQVDLCLKVVWLREMCKWTNPD